MSLQLQVDASLKPFNSFGVDVRARLFAEAHNDDEVREALQYCAERELPLLVIGGGSNLLLTQDVEALVLRMATRGIRVIEDGSVWWSRPRRARYGMPLSCGPWPRGSPGLRI